MDPRRIPIAALRRGQALGRVSRGVAGAVSAESERWFRSSLAAVEWSIVWAERRAGALAARVRFWPRPKPSRERLRGLLQKEARRARLVVPAAELDLFTERMAILIDLVLSGSIAVHDVAFEGAEPPVPSPEVCEPSADTGQVPQTSAEAP